MSPTDRAEKVARLADDLGIVLPNRLVHDIQHAILDAEADAVAAIGGPPATKRWYCLRDQELDPAKNWGRFWKRPASGCGTVEQLRAEYNAPISPDGEHGPGYQSEDSK